MKNSTQVLESYSDGIILPQIIKIDRNLFSLSFKNMKLLPAQYMIQQAIKAGLIDEESCVIETSSGNFALGLGLVCQKFNIPFYIFSDPAIHLDLKERLEHLGGKVHIVTHEHKQGNHQIERLQQLSLFLKNNDKCYWTKQYDNEENQLSYAPVAEMILDQFGTNIELVGAVGSGGSTGGIINYLRYVDESIKLVGVDTFNSVLFGLKDGPRQLRGLGNSLLPKNLDHSLYDEVHWVNASEAYFSTRLLHASQGLYAGPTTGAAYMVAAWRAKKNQNQNVIFISPDDGTRYAMNVYNRQWLRKNGFSLTPVIDQPKDMVLENPGRPEWSYLKWNRLSLEKILNREKKFYRLQNEVYCA